MEWYIDSNGVTMRRLDVWEGGNDQGHYVETASQIFMGAVQSSRVWAVYLALAFAPAL